LVESNTGETRAVVGFSLGCKYKKLSLSLDKETLDEEGNEMLDDDVLLSIAMSRLRKERKRKKERKKEEGKEKQNIRRNRALQLKSSDTILGIVHELLILQYNAFHVVTK